MTDIYVPDCGQCQACRIHHHVPGPDTTPPWQWGMILCKTCGNKRCPHATDHRLACTGGHNDPLRTIDNYPYHAKTCWYTVTRQRKPR